MDFCVPLSFKTQISHGGVRSPSFSPPLASDINLSGSALSDSGAIYYGKTLSLTFLHQLPFFSSFLFPGYGNADFFTELSLFDGSLFYFSRGHSRICARALLSFIFYLIILNKFICAKCRFLAKPIDNYIVNIYNNVDKSGGGAFFMPKDLPIYKLNTFKRRKK